MRSEMRIGALRTSYYQFISADIIAGTNNIYLSGLIPFELYLADMNKHFAFIFMFYIVTHAA